MGLMITALADAADEHFYLLSEYPRGSFIEGTTTSSRHVVLPQRLQIK
jgi:hypothetical protein